MGSLLTHETRINTSTESLENVFLCQASIRRGRGQGNRSRGKWGIGLGWSKKKDRKTQK